MLHIILYQPEIPPNTGNIMRLCANMGASLHLIEPLGFRLEEKRLRRAGLDYRDWIEVQRHARLEDCLPLLETGRLFACTTKAGRRHDQVEYRPGDALLFGPESRGLPQAVLEMLPQRQRIRIPMRPHSRSLNLANAVSVVAYEAWRQLGFRGGV